ncbi:MAG TPA: MgtC/SapB family protein [Vicinamibacterales bacterium]|nr:MgtC/SapB family protein [Vicinamibacterales bacterium]
MTLRRAAVIVALLGMLFGPLALVLPASVSAQQPSVTDELTQQSQPGKKGSGIIDFRSEVAEAVVRLPIAAILGAALALRPRRRGTPTRNPAVIQTQIILAIVGALVMMVVGTNLARAFGVVGAAGLVRYRAKIEDPKDAGVMLSTLAIGLGAGVGLYAMVVFSAVFILLALWVIESFEPDRGRPFDLAIKMGKDTDARRQEFESVLRRYRIDFELRSSADDEVSYDARVPLDVQRDRVTNAILKLDPEGHAAVEWSEKKPKTK